MNKLTLNEIVGYLPYGLKVKCNGLIGNLIWISRDAIGVRMEFQIDQSNTYSLQGNINPILNRIEDMSEELLDKWIDIQERGENNLQFSIKANEFMYSNHIDIHNLIDRGLAVDKKTIQP